MTKQLKDSYGIGAVARMTGLTDHTIRVWERRYGAVVAERAANGRRIYTQADVEKLSLLKFLTDQGIAIGTIASADTAALRERAEQVTSMASRPIPDRIRIAMLGRLLPRRLQSAKEQSSPLEFIVTATDEDCFVADLETSEVDVVVFETPVLDERSAARFRSFLENAGTGRGVLAYGFGRSEDVERLRTTGIVVLRSPVGPDDLHAAVLSAFDSKPSPPRPSARPPANAEWRAEGDVPARQFTEQQLATLLSVTTSIDCECPRHLAELVSDLGAFETYSAGCAHRDEADAALHRYLHRTSAEARALIEAALKRVADAEEIDY